MEGLNVAMKSSIQNSLYSGIDIPNHGPSVSHLFYADDAIFISDWSYSNFSDLSNILKCSHFSLGLKVNFHKSKVFGIGVPTSDVISCDLPVHLPWGAVGANMNLKRNWRPIIEKVQCRIYSWKLETLSFGGRQTLVKSPSLFYFLIFKAPSSVVNNLEKIRRKFLWGSWVAWDRVLANKDSGGLGPQSLFAMQIVLEAEIGKLFNLEKGNWWYS
uniref:Reverse transcriptase domain-containing protein n=1 Tax=Lactuca sativa TaxID=4236 RepID=A0A9R1WL53_LACSA|nr:hypothetical protein LSAT_V11C100047050 [Lactuca sativa]